LDFLYSSRPGATLIIIKGHHHLHQCAYIGDNSSEEEEELMELDKSHQETNYSYPSFYQRARTDVTFHKQENAPKNQHNVLTKNLDLKDHGENFDMSLHEAHKAKTRLNSAKAIPPKNEVKKILTSDELFDAVVNKISHYQRRGEGDGIDEDKKRWIMLRKLIGDTAQSSKEGPDSWFNTKNEQKKNILTGKQPLKENLTDGVTSDPEEGLKGKTNSMDQHRFTSVHNPNIDEGRSRRHLHLINSLSQSLGEHDEEGNVAEEEVSMV